MADKKKKTSSSGNGNGAVLESLTLASLRDSLLPRLMKGEVYAIDRLIVEESVRLSDAGQGWASEFLGKE
ncbi:MAG: hypothetical protein MUO77_19080 [Anaerolineales bacterium]|nr:hypothetical protein [Anaerolineales bacterium]